ncbi:UNVERIFIED_CONTAM: hypothetical protein K2H54_036349 [Gekko kuhli]
MKVSSPPPPGSVICAMVVDKRHVAAAVKSLEMAMKHRTSAAPPEHPIQVEGNQDAQYFSGGETLCQGVTVPYERPKVGSTYTTILFVHRYRQHPLLIVITLQSPDGQILGRGSFEVLVSCIPGSDQMRDEEQALEGGHFVERHQKQLIEKVSGMDIILPRLLRFVLNDDDYRRIRTEQTDAGMMAKLLELMPGWGKAQKDELYRELIATNGPLIRALKEEEEESRLQVYEAHASPFINYELREYLVEGHQEELIRCAVGVDVVVEFLESHAVITFHQMQDIRGTSQQQMQKLYELMPNWTVSQKLQMHDILSKTNRRLITQLQGGHFVDRHREELIERVTEVPLNQLRGSALDEEQYETLLKCATEKMQMQALFEMVQKWNRPQKDQLYRALAETNPDVVKVLEAGTLTDQQGVSPSKWREEALVLAALQLDVLSFSPSF